MKPYGVRYFQRYDSDSQIETNRAFEKRTANQIRKEQLVVAEEMAEHDAGGTPFSCLDDTCDCNTLEDSSGAWAATYVGVDLEFTCRLCGLRMGDFFYRAELDCCIDCAGLEFVP